MKIEANDRYDVIRMDQNDDDWYSMRLGYVTASGVSNVITRSGKPSASRTKYAAKLAAEVLTGQRAEDLDENPFDGNYWTRRGHDLEPVALKQFSEIFEADLDTDVGFILMKELDFGFSPDAIENAATKYGDGIVVPCDAKCLMAESHLRVAADPKVGTNDYFQQIQAQIYIMDAPCGTLFFYHPELMPIAVRVDRDDKFIDDMLLEVERCIDIRDEIVDKLKGSHLVFQGVV